jgi:hypothetical protein
MITVTAVWGDWEFNERPSSNRTVHPTPGRNRPLVIQCSTPFTAGVLKDAFTKLGCSVTQEHS